MTPAEIQFAADGMLQSLGTWLRLMGYDCITAARCSSHGVAAGFGLCKNAPVSRVGRDAAVVCGNGAPTESDGGVSFGSRALLEQAVAENRVFLTRNAHLSDNLPHALLACGQIVYVIGEHLPEQLREVVAKFSLETEQFVFTRCVACNEPLRRVERAEAVGHVPNDVVESETEFWRCRRCGKTFWRGSHVRNSVERLRRWLGVSGGVAPS
jgi:uncharacterized protein